MKTLIVTITSLFSFFYIKAQSENNFADIVIDSFYSDTNPNFDSFYGKKPGNSIEKISTNEVLGNNNSFVSLPKDSYIIVGFIDNYIIDAPNQKDIFIEEIGAAGEYADIYVSYNNIEYTFLGEANDAVINKFDLDDISFKLPVRYVKVVGKDNRGGSPGFDLVSVSGLPGANRESNFSLKEEIPEIETKIIPKKTEYQIKFNTNSFFVNDIGIKKLLLIKYYITDNLDYTLVINGHTDLLGTNNYNLKLSEKRVLSVYNILLKYGVKSEQMEKKYFGELNPISTKTTKKGNAMNRRVEIILRKKQNI